MENKEHGRNVPNDWNASVNEAKQKKRQPKGSLKKKRTRGMRSTRRLGTGSFIPWGHERQAVKVLGNIPWRLPSASTEQR
jgi:hypothetical protein